MSPSLLHAGMLTGFVSCRSSVDETAAVSPGVQLPCHVQKTLFSYKSLRPLGLTVFLPHIQECSLSFRECVCLFGLCGFCVMCGMCVCEYVLCMCQFICVVCVCI